MSDLIKPGTDNQRPGKYHEVGPRGGEVPDPKHATIEPGDRLPPASKKGNKWTK
ncbi:YjzC family protein [Leuconostoc mesenteroides]|uniref:YjzC family protein n=1 Tax=Leuconostoc mesenteroides TaxID=1245 RepID=UPI00235E19EC|nr:YjzC family protein [Leuconostoc mesenteroides]